MSSYTFLSYFSICSRSEVESSPNGHSCDIIGLVHYVGRTERTRKRGYLEDYNTYELVQKYLVKNKPTYLFSLQSIVKIFGSIVGYMLWMGPQNNLSYWNCLQLLSHLYLNKFTQVLNFVYIIGLVKMLS